MEQKCGTNHPTLQPRFKQVFKLVSARLRPATHALTAVALLFAPVQALANDNEPSAGAQAGQFNAADGAILPAAALVQLRDDFVQAERNVSRMTPAEFQQLQARFAHYPLWPYLEGRYLAANVGVVGEAAITQFMERYSGTPVERTLRERWLSYLARRNDKSRFVRDFIDRGNDEHRCRYLRYRLDTESDLAADFWAQVEASWLQADSQPRLCDSVFKAWQERGLRTDEHIWQRFDLALAANNWSMARYLRSLLPHSDQQEKADQLLTMHQNANALTHFKRFPSDSERVKSHLISRLLTLSWQDLSQTKQLWSAMQNHFEFSVLQRERIDGQIALVLAVRREPEAMEWFAKLPDTSVSESLAHWHLTTLVSQGNYPAVLELTAKSEQSTPQQRYWQAKALKQLGRQLEADALWHELAQERHYYGYMAASQLGVPANVARQSLVVEPSALATLMSRREAQRAYEFLQLERYFDARREWNLVRARISPDERSAAAVLASQWQWLDQSIRELASVAAFDDLDRRFPLGYRELLTRHAGNNNLDLAWVYAIIRRESAFQPDARSPVGARGLMQIMPATADYIQRQTPGPGNRVPARLDSPDDNIRLGTRYMAELLARHRGNWLLATASYNAGYHRVMEWVPDQDLPADLWIETIPYQETRDYVKAVLTYQQIYAVLLGQDDNLMQHMHSMRINPDGGICTHVEQQSVEQELELSLFC